MPENNAQQTTAITQSLPSLTEAAQRSFTLQVAGDYRWFRMPAEQFDAIHYAAMAIYKICIILFNLVPFVALLIVA